MVGPTDGALEQPGGGLSPKRHALLLRTHWLRVAMVTAYGLLMLIMVAQSS